MISVKVNHRCPSAPAWGVVEDQAEAEINTLCAVFLLERGLKRGGRAPLKILDLLTARNKSI